MWQLGVSLARNSGMRPFISKGRTYRRAKPIFVSTLLITLKGISPPLRSLNLLLLRALPHTPAGASPCTSFTLAVRRGRGTPRPISTSVFRPRRVKVKLSAKWLRRTLTLHLSFSGRIAAATMQRKGVRAVPQGQRPEDKERAGRKPLPLVASPVP